MRRRGSSASWVPSPAVRPGSMKGWLTFYPETEVHGADPDAG